MQSQPSASGHEGCRSTEPITVRTGKNAARPGLSRTTAPATSGPLGEARDPGQIKLAALVAAGDEETAAVCQVVGLVSAGDGTIVHRRLFPGLASGYRQLVERARAS
jgi:hypothetical protein